MGEGSIRFLGFPNHTSSDYAEYTTIGSIGLEPADMGVEWLGTEEPSDLARLLTLDPIQSQWGFGTTLVPSTFDGFALINHNITDGGQVRFIASSVVGMEGSLIIPTRVGPNSIIASTNRTGAVTDIDEHIETSDGLFMGPTNTALPWSVTLKWPTLTGTMVSTEDLFSLVLRVRRISVAGGAGTQVLMPKVAAELAVPVFSLGYRAVTNTSTDTDGQILIFPFNRADYTSDTNFQVTLSFTPASGTTNEYIVLETASLYYETATQEFDSGWITVTGDPRGAPNQPTRSVHYFPEEPWEDVLSYAVLIRSDQTRHDPPLRSDGLTIPLGVLGTVYTYVQAGVLCAGEGVQISDGLTAPGAAPTKVAIDEIAGFSTAGQTYGADAWRRRVSDPVQLLVTRTELDFIRDQIAWRRGHSGAFYVAMEPGVPLAQQVLSGFWTTVKEVSAPQWAGVDGGVDCYLISITFEEKL